MLNFSTTTQRQQEALFFVYRHANPSTKEIQRQKVWPWSYLKWWSSKVGYKAPGGDTHDCHTQTGSGWDTKFSASVVLWLKNRHIWFQACDSLEVKRIKYKIQPQCIHVLYNHVLLLYSTCKMKGLKWKPPAQYASVVSTKINNTCTCIVVFGILYSKPLWRWMSMLIHCS